MLGCLIKAGSLAVYNCGLRLSRALTLPKASHLSERMHGLLRHGSPSSSVFDAGTFENSVMPPLQLSSLGTLFSLLTIVWLCFLQGLDTEGKPLVKVHASDAEMRAGLPYSGPIPWKSIREKCIYASQRETTRQV